MKCMDIDNIIEDSFEEVTTETIDNVQTQIDIAAIDKKRGFIGVLTVFGFLAVSSIIITMFLGGKSDKQELAKISNNSQNIEISKMVSFRSLAEIEPAAGGSAIDDLLEWENEASPLSNSKDIKSSNKNNLHKKTLKKKSIEKKKIATKQDKNKDIEELKKSIEALSKKIKNNTQNRNNAKVIDDILGRLERISNKVTNMQSQLQSVNSKVLQIEKSIIASKDEISSLKSGNESDKVNKNKIDEKQETNINWQLKSARSNMAWISREDKASLKAVVVGDIVKGLGKILEINKGSNGKWFVKCEKGVIRQ